MGVYPSRAATPAPNDKQDPCLTPAARATESPFEVAGLGEYDAGNSAIQIRFIIPRRPRGGRAGASGANQGPSSTRAAPEADETETATVTDQAPNHVRCRAGEALDVAGDERQGGASLAEQAIPRGLIW